MHKGRKQERQQQAAERKTAALKRTVDQALARLNMGQYAAISERERLAQRKGKGKS